MLQIISLIIDKWEHTRIASWLFFFSRKFIPWKWDTTIIYSPWRNFIYRYYHVSNIKMLSYRLASADLKLNLQSASVTRRMSFIQYQATLTLSLGSSTCSLSQSFSFKRISVMDGFENITVGFRAPLELNVRSACA